MNIQNRLTTQRPVQRLCYWITERESIRKKRAHRHPSPWTPDRILHEYRFCNVNREHDAVTVWIRDNVRIKYASHGANFIVPQLLMCRVYNEPSTLVHLLPFVDIGATLYTVAKLRADGHRLLRGAYMMPVHGKEGKGKSTDEYYLEAVRAATEVDWTQCGTLASVAERLVRLKGIGEFLANQVCADLRYTPQWRDAPDWTSFVLCGPGTRRGLDRIAGIKNPTGNKTQKHYQEAMAELWDLELSDKLEAQIMDHFIDRNNLSNCLCEWDKYERVFWGEAEQLRKYKQQ